MSGCILTILGWLCTHFADTHFCSNTL